MLTAIGAIIVDEPGFFERQAKWCLEKEDLVMLRRCTSLQVLFLCYWLVVIGALGPVCCEVRVLHVPTLFLLTVPQTSTLCSELQTLVQVQGPLLSFNCSTHNQFVKSEERDYDLILLYGEDSGTCVACRHVVPPSPFCIKR